MDASPNAIFYAEQTSNLSETFLPVRFKHAPASAAAAAAAAPAAAAAAAALQRAALDFPSQMTTQS